MGKVDSHQPLPVVQQRQQVSGTFRARGRCAVAVSRLFSFKCAAVLMFGAAAFVSALFLLISIRYRHVGFEAKESVKERATVQAYFRLNKPVSELVPYMARLEYDLSGEIGVISSKVTILSMHQEGKSNWTDVVFGFIPDPINSMMNQASLSLLKLTLTEIFLKQCNLTLSYSLFRDPSSFEILKFPGGITIIPERAPLFTWIPPVLFHFTLNSSICEITENLVDLKEQLKRGLHLLPNEVVYIQLTNKNGSTKDPPVTVEASVVSDHGIPSLERLRQLAQIITGPAKNLGLDHFVFGKVKQVSLSSFLQHSLHPPSPAPTPTPTPSPSPSPASSPDLISSSAPSLAPFLLPSSSPHFHHSMPPCYASHPSEPSKAFHQPGRQNVHRHYSFPWAYFPKLSVAHCGSTNPSIPPLTSHMPPTTSPPASTKSPVAGSILSSPSPFLGMIHGHRDQEEEQIQKDLVSSDSPHHVLPSFSPSWTWTPRTHWTNLIGLLTALLLI